MVFTPDLDEAERFYRDVLALELTEKTANALTFDLGGTEFRVFQCEDEAPRGHKHGGTAGTACAFEVPSVEAAMRRLKARGVTFLHEAPAQDARSGVRYAAFHAPGGNVHEIMERDRGQRRRNDAKLRP
ncbi:MAG: VOC family protein [Caulobacteraceae bacterium]